MKRWIVTFSFLLTAFLGRESEAGQLLGPASYTDGPTPFISFVHLKVNGPLTFKSVRWQIQPKEGSETRPVMARYTGQYLTARGYFDAASGRLTVPVFGLYAGRDNPVTLTLAFTDGSTTRRSVTISTSSFDGGTYSNPTIVQSRASGTPLSYDFIMLKNIEDPNTPIIIDTDGEVRWIGTAGVGVSPSIFIDNAIYLISGTTLLRTELDGQTSTIADYSSLGVTEFHHNIDPGKSGMILDADTTTQIESVNYEVDLAGNVLKSWNLGDIISAAMIAGGDDPADFVQPPLVDWFHNNATAYRSSDNSLIVSSRENFVIALDYDSGAIKWILGDRTKKWFLFPSLRKFALKLGRDTLPPIGQHAVSLSGDDLLLFDNGANSVYQMPPGESRDYSAPRKYQIDLAASRATEVWHYLPDPSISSPFCSSIYEDATSNYLIDYTVGGPYLFTEIVGLDGSGNKAFDYMYEKLGFCGTAWNAIPIHWENLRFE